MSRVLGIGIMLAVMSGFAFGETPESRTIRIAYTQFPPSNIRMKMARRPEA
ncbi:hypothetical protein ACFQGA_02605 [Marinobacter koreensis]|uniref:hypothetical protein n=1 Tax=Marinobacter koreensis TaxID=335974 RepID=UPI00361041C6